MVDIVRIKQANFTRGIVKVLFHKSIALFNSSYKGGVGWGGEAEDGGYNGEAGGAVAVEGLPSRHLVLNIPPGYGYQEFFIL